MTSPSNLHYVTGDILEFDCDFLVHQVNTVSKKGKGLASAIFERYPYADWYTKRQILNETAVVPGLRYFYPGRDEDGEWKSPAVVSFVAQIAPGEPGDSWSKRYNVDETKDTSECRLGYFKWCLLIFANEVNNPSCFMTKTDRKIAFPHGIGCGIAGGNWPDYEKAISEFAASLLLDSKCQISVFIVEKK